MSDGLPALATAPPLPIAYETARQALATCERIDECKDWSNKAAALTAYAKQAGDVELEHMAQRLRTRALRRCGELLEPIDARPNNLTQNKGTLTFGSQRDAAAAAGLSIHQERIAVRLARISEDEFEELVEGKVPPTVTALSNLGRTIMDAAKAMRAERAGEIHAERDARLVALSNTTEPLPSRIYPVIYADPPWQYDFSPSATRAVENHYPTMPIEEILALDVSALATPDAMLFLWTPPALVQKAFRVLETWGFTFATMMVWDKQSIGPGIYFRQQFELLLLGKRGTPITPLPGTQPSSILRAPRAQHSAKPVEVYAIIERMYPGLPRIELFSRAARVGWDAWGNEANQ